MFFIILYSFLYNILISVDSFIFTVRLIIHEKLSKSSEIDANCKKKALRCLFYVVNDKRSVINAGLLTAFPITLPVFIKRLRRTEHYKNLFQEYPGGKMLFFYS